MEALGAVASVLTIWEATNRVIAFNNAVKEAPEDWKRYCDGLRRVACTQEVLENVLKDYPDVDVCTPEDNGEQHMILEETNRVLKEVRNDASILLERCSQNVSKKSGKSSNPALRFRDWLYNRREAVHFALKEGRMGKMIETVERTHSQLHLAVTSVSLRASEKWHDQATGLLRTINAQIVQNGKDFEEWKSHDCNFGQERIRIYVDEEPWGRKTTEPAVGLKSRVRTKKSHFPGRPLKFFKNRKDLVCATIEGGDDLCHDADTELTDQGEPPGQALDHSGCQEVHTQERRGVELGYIFEKETQSLFQVPVDSEEYQSATGPSSKSETGHDHSDAIRADEFAASMTEDEWNKGQLLPVEELMELSEWDCDPNHRTDDEMTWGQQCRAMPLQSETSAFIAESVDLNLCKKSTSGTLRFCIQRIVVATAGQTYCVTEPCARTRRNECNHVTLEVDNEDGQITDTQLPCRIDLRLSDCVCPTENEFEDDAGCHCRVVSLFDRCGRRRSCTHTVVDDAEANWARCSVQNNLRALLVDIRSEMEDSGPDTERGQSESGVNSDEDVSALSRLVLLDQASQVPNEVEWTYSQAKKWALLLKISQSFDGKALTWLWVMWKLDMRTEFKRLSSVIQQQARHPISLHQQCPTENKYPEPPAWMKDLLNQRRLEVLSRVKDRVESELESHREAYRNNYLEEPQYWWNLANAMTTGLAFGYLQLEKQSWFGQDRSQSDADGLDFRGRAFHRLNTAFSP